MTIFVKLYLPVKVILQNTALLVQQKCNLTGFIVSFKFSFPNLINFGIKDAL